MSGDNLKYLKHLNKNMYIDEEASAKMSWIGWNIKYESLSIQSEKERIEVFDQLIFGQNCPKRSSVEISGLVLSQDVRKLFLERS